jgi:predicted ester cyclase
MVNENENKTLVERFFVEVWNGRKLGLLEELLRFPYEIQNLLGDSPPQQVRRDEMEVHIKEWFEAFPDLVVSVRQTLAEGDKVFVESRYIGTHLGAYREIQATLRGIDISVLGVFTVASGKLAGHSVLVDAWSLYRQLGQTF